MEPDIPPVSSAPSLAWGLFNMVLWLVIVAAETWVALAWVDIGYKIVPWAMRRVQRIRLKLSLKSIPRHGIVMRAHDTNKSYYSPVSRSWLRPHVRPSDKSLELLCAKGHVVAVMPWHYAPHIQEMILFAPGCNHEDTDINKYKTILLCEARDTKPSPNTDFERQFQCLCGAPAMIVTGSWGSAHHATYTFHVGLPIWSWLLETGRIRRRT